MKPPRITLYTTRKCPHCRQLKAYLQQKKLKFVEFDIETNRRAFKDFQRLGGRGVPVTMIGEQRVDGFNKGLIDKLLSRKAY